MEKIEFINYLRKQIDILTMYVDELENDETNTTTIHHINLYMLNDFLDCKIMIDGENENESE